MVNRTDLEGMTQEQVKEYDTEFFLNNVDSLTA